MNDEMKKEIAKVAEMLGMDADSVEEKTVEICTKHDIDPEKETLLAKGMLRQWYSSVRNAQNAAGGDSSASGSGGFYKTALGFFISLDDARDMMAFQRERVVNEYKRDSETCYRLGKVAVITVDGDGYEMRRMHEDEEKVGMIENLPDNHVELDNGQFLVPVDYTKMYGANENKNFGKPLPKTEFRRSGVFIGEVNGVMGKYFFNYKGEASVDFTPPTFELVHFDCIVNSSNNTRIHGGKEQTLLSLTVNADLADGDEKKHDASELSMQDELMQRSEGNYSPLVDLDRYHSTVTNKEYNDRFVFTDGTVSSVNMTPTGNGNRIVNLTDLNADFDYDDGYNNGVTCWVPSHIDIDFGIGSQVIVVGRTSQGTDDEGNVRPVSINVSGLYVIDKRGGPSTTDAPVEDNTDWI